MANARRDGGLQRSGFWFAHRGPCRWGPRSPRAKGSAPRLRGKSLTRSGCGDAVPASRIASASEAGVAGFLEHLDFLECLEPGTAVSAGEWARSTRVASVCLPALSYGRGFVPVPPSTPHHTSPKSILSILQSCLKQVARHSALAPAAYRHLRHP